MLKILTAADTRTDLIRKGYAQAAKFSWKAMAQNVLKIYDEISNEM